MIERERETEREKAELHSAIDSSIASLPDVQTANAWVGGFGR